MKDCCPPSPERMRGTSPGCNSGLRASSEALVSGTTGAAAVQASTGCCAGEDAHCADDLAAPGKETPIARQSDCCEAASSHGAGKAGSAIPPIATSEACCASGVTIHSASPTFAPAGHPIPSSPASHFAGDDCCSAKEQEIAALGSHADVRRVLIIVLAINLAMFFAEFTAGIIAHSTALMADSVDMLGDALVYMLSLYALNRGLRWRAGAALLKGGIIAIFGIWVFVEVIRKLVGDVVPTAETMGIFGLIALVANLTCLALLYRFRHRDVNMSSTFECSRNDVIANTGVLVAAGGVYAFNAGWPDIVVGSVIALLFFRSAIRVLKEAWPQFRSVHPRAVALD